MWIFPTKKQIKSELKKITKSFGKTNNRIDDNTKVSTDLKSQIDKNKLDIARLEGVVSVLLTRESPQNLKKSQSVSISPKRSQGNIETKAIRSIRRSKKSLIIAEISKLAPLHSTIEIYETIVLEKGLCSKASFYRYIASLKSQSHKGIETKQRLR